MKALVTVIRHEDETLTYSISDPDHSGVAEITIETLVELFRMAGIEPGTQP